MRNTVNSNSKNKSKNLVAYYRIIKVHTARTINDVVFLRVLPFALARAEHKVAACVLLLYIGILVYLSDLLTTN